MILCVLPGQRRNETLQGTSKNSWYCSACFPVLNFLRGHTMITEFLKKQWHNARMIGYEKKRLSLQNSCSSDPENLKRIPHARLKEILTAGVTDGEWSTAERYLATVFDVPDKKTGGVNPGDRRALYYIIRALKPLKVLEIGTHVGASTLHIAFALKQSQDPGLPVSGSLTTVDIQDVNDPLNGYWKKLGLSKSPADLMKTIHNDSVIFVNADSIEFLRRSEEKYDFVFLDGDHSASAVYQEICLALKCINKEGCILLHDYHPGNKPLWPQEELVCGPHLAVQRLLKEGLRVSAIPLGSLSWPTKYGTNITSLALLSRT